MLNAWRADPTTTVRQVIKNCYLFEFNNAEDLRMAQLGGVWTYRGDLVALKQVSSDLELNPATIDTVAVWVMFMNLSVNAFKDEGIIMIAQKVGTPISEPTKGLVNGRRFVKVKVLIPVGEPVKDFVKVTHPSLGQIKVYCSYEKVSRICVFCGRIGHKMAGCQDHVRLALLLKKPGQAERFKGSDILAPKRGAWLVNPALAPGFCVRRNTPASSSVSKKVAAKAGYKRSLEESVNEFSFFSENDMNLDE